VFWALKGACYRCLYPEPPPPGLFPRVPKGRPRRLARNYRGYPGKRNNQDPIGAEGVLVNRLLLFDAWQLKFRELKLQKDPNCPICGVNPTIKALIDYEEFCGLKAQPAAANQPKMEEIGRSSSARDCGAEMIYR